MSSGIYKITNKVNGKVYIGQSKNLENRKIAHFDNAKHKNYALYNAMRKYGVENFEFTVVQECDIALLDSLEIYYIRLYNTYLGDGYNCTEGGSGVITKSTKHSVYCINTGIAYCSIAEAARNCELSEKQIYDLCKKPYHSLRTTNIRFCYIEDIHLVLEGNNYQGSACILFPSMKIVGNRGIASRLCNCDRRSNCEAPNVLKWLQNGKSENLNNRFMLLTDFLSIEPSTDITFEELCAKYYIPTDKKERLAFINTKIDNLMQEITTTGVYTFTTNGDCVGIYTSLKECAQALGVSKPDITRSANHEVDKVGKYIFRCVNI